MAPSCSCCLARSQREPFKDALFLPSRYLEAQDELMLSARSMFHGLFGYDEPEIIEQLKAFGGVFRHPLGQGRQCGLLRPRAQRRLPRRKVGAVRHAVESLLTGCPTWPFDHNEVVAYAKERLKRRVKRRPVGFHSASGRVHPRPAAVPLRASSRQDVRQAQLQKETVQEPLAVRLWSARPLVVKWGSTKAAASSPSTEERYQRMKKRGVRLLVLRPNHRAYQNNQRAVAQPPNSAFECIHAVQLLPREELDLALHRAAVGRLEGLCHDFARPAHVSVGC